jgi:putative transposase
MKTRELAHSVYKHHYHLVWGTKYRRKYLKEYVRSEFEHCLYTTIKELYPTLFIESLNTDQDHVHLQLEIPPNIAVSVAVKRLKWHTSIHLKQKFKFIKAMYLEGSIWSVGYYSSTVGLNEETIKKYIEYQGKKEVPQTLTLFESS